MNRKEITSLAIVVFFGLLLQVGYIFLDCSNTPSDTAVTYARAYYQLDPAMMDLMCDPALADSYLYNKTLEARERGLSEKFTRYALTGVETWTEYDDSTSAAVHLTAHRRPAPNPVYAFVGWIFQMGQSHEVEASFQLRLEEGQWRVCDTSLPL